MLAGSLCTYVNAIIVIIIITIVEMVIRQSFLGASGCCFAMLSHPFENVENLPEVDGLQAETFQEAYKLCCDNHTHRDDLYEKLDVDNDEPEADADDEFEDVNLSQPTPPATLANFKTYGLAHPGDGESRIAITWENEIPIERMTGAVT